MRRNDILKCCEVPFPSKGELIGFYCPTFRCGHISHCHGYSSRCSHRYSNVRCTAVSIFQSPRIRQTNISVDLKPYFTLLQHIIQIYNSKPSKMSLTPLGIWAPWLITMNFFLPKVRDMLFPRWEIAPEGIRTQLPLIPSKTSVFVSFGLNRKHK